MAYKGKHAAGGRKPPRPAEEPKYNSTPAGEPIEELGQSTVPAGEPTEQPRQRTTPVSEPIEDSRYSRASAGEPIIRNPEADRYEAKNRKQAMKHAGKKKLPGPAKAVIAVLIVLLILFGGAWLVMNHYLNKINKADDIEVVSPEEATDEINEYDEASDAPEVDPDEVTWDDVDDLETDNLINILLVGQDSLVGARERSDTMIVVSINPDTGEVALISFLRDLYVQMPEGYQDNRMNAAYAFGGFPYLYEVLEKNFGITCEGGFEVNFDGFMSVVDTLGGVDIDLTEAEAEYIGGGLSAGMNHLDGQQALTYSRIRYIDSDFYRTNRQRTVLLALFEKVRGSDLTGLMDLVNTLLPMMTTDMSNTEIMSLVIKLAPLLKGMTLTSCRVPADDTYTNATIRGMMVLVPDLDKNRTYLQSVLPYSD